MPNPAWPKVAIRFGYNISSDPAVTAAQKRELIERLRRKHVTKTATAEAIGINRKRIDAWLAESGYVWRPNLFKESDNG